MKNRKCFYQENGNISISNVRDSIIDVTQYLGRLVDYQRLIEELHHLEREHVSNRENHEIEKNIRLKKYLIRCFEDDIYSLIETIISTPDSSLMKRVEEYMHEGQLTKANDCINLEDLYEKQKKLLKEKELIITSKQCIDEQLKINAKEYAAKAFILSSRSVLSYHFNSPFYRTFEENLGISFGSQNDSIEDNKNDEQSHFFEIKALYESSFRSWKFGWVILQYVFFLRSSEILYSQIDFPEPQVRDLLKEAIDIISAAIDQDDDSEAISVNGINYLRAISLSAEFVPDGNIDEERDLYNEAILFISKNPEFKEYLCFFQNALSLLSLDEALSQEQDFLAIQEIKCIIARSKKDILSWDTRDIFPLDTFVKIDFLQMYFLWIDLFLEREENETPLEELKGLIYDNVNLFYGDECWYNKHQISSILNFLFRACLESDTQRTSHQAERCLIFKKEIVDFLILTISQKKKDPYFIEGLLDWISSFLEASLFDEEPLLSQERIKLSQNIIAKINFSDYEQSLNHIGICHKYVEVLKSIVDAYASGYTKTEKEISEEEVCSYIIAIYEKICYYGKKIVEKNADKKSIEEQIFNLWNLFFFKHTYCKAVISELPIEYVEIEVLFSMIRKDSDIIYRFSNRFDPWGSSIPSKNYPSQLIYGDFYAYVGSLFIFTDPVKAMFYLELAGTHYDEISSDLSSDYSYAKYIKDLLLCSIILKYCPKKNIIAIAFYIKKNIKTILDANPNERQWLELYRHIGILMREAVDFL